MNNLHKDLDELDAHKWYNRTDKKRTLTHHIDAGHEWGGETGNHYRAVSYGKYTWAIDMDEFYHHIGSDAEDRKWILSKEYRQARHQARQWLAVQKDKEIISLSMQGTTELWLDSGLDVDGVSEEEDYAFAQAQGRAAELRHEFSVILTARHITILGGQ